jgi:pimeloyl-ACP methyl ester carboxylesterase
MVAQPVVTHLNLCGTRVKVMRAGQGAPLLFLRGTDASDDWRPFLDDLAGRFDVIVPEHPGFGGEARPDWLDRIADYSNYYLDVIDALGLDHVHLVGHGMGGWIAAELASRSTKKLASLTLADAQGLYVDGVDTIDTFLRTEEESVRDLFQDEKLAATELERRLTPETEDVRLNNQVVIAQTTWQPRGYDPHLRKWLHRIDIPTLIVWGENDRLLPQAYAREWGKLIPGARVEIIANCGHAPHIEKPADFVRLIEAFAKAQRVAA